MLKLFDVLVVGSGPAACAVAATCQNVGLKVLIVTEETGRKIDTVSPQPLESIHPGVASLLEKIGAKGIEVNSAFGHYSGIQAGDTYTPLGEDSYGVWQGLHINRQLFNAHLLDRMIDLGVSVRFNVRVDDFLKEENRVVGIKTSGESYFANFIVDASGTKSIAGKKLNFKRKFFSPPLLCWTGVSGYFETYPFDQQAAHFIPTKNGWTWLASYHPNMCSWTRLTIKGEKSLWPPDELRAYSTIGKIHFANMRWRLFRPVCSEGILLCGDAAGILDPAAGQGIFNALLSGIVAANTIVSCFQQPEIEAFHLANYDDWFVSQFEEKVRQLRSYYDEHGIRW